MRLRLFFVFLLMTLPLLCAVIALHAPERFVVCLDPGHPSENNSGKGFSNGLQEVKVCWQVAVLLKKKLERNGIEVVMTKRTELQYVTNERRAKIANNAHVDLFLRLHADAGSGSGFAVYYPRKKGTVRGFSGPSAAVMTKSKLAAEIFFGAFSEMLSGKLRNNGLKGDENTSIGRKQGALTGSIFSAVPTILVEMLFLTNKRDADWIRKQENRSIYAEALEAGVLAVRARRSPSSARASVFRFPQTPGF